MPNRIYESMTRVQLGEYTIRVWQIEKGTITNGPDRYITEALNVCPPSVLLISETLDQFPDVSAYEILDANGNGAIVYPDWP